MKRLISAGSVALLLCATAAAPGQAAVRHKPKKHPPVYSNGTYSGKVVQLLPQPVLGQIRFGVSGRSLTGLSVKVTELCGGLIATTLQDSPRGFSVGVARNGTFSYNKTGQGDHIQLKGRLHGNKATGTFFDALKTGTLDCAMGHPATFSAQR